MFKWLSHLGENPDRTIPEDQPRLDLAGLMKLERAVIFKHSRSCPVSWAAAKQVRRFQDENPSVPVYTITVQEEREFSKAIAEKTGIRHESPQVIVFRDGKAVANASHEDVTEENLASMIAGSQDS